MKGINLKNRYTLLLVLFLISIMQYFIIELSYSSFETIRNTLFISKLVAFATILFIDIIFLLICRSFRIAMNLVMLLTLMLSIVNYYIVAFRGTPFTFSLVSHFLTALNVLSTYTFAVDKTLFFILGIAIIAFIIINIPFKNRFVERKISIVGMCLIGIVIFVSYFSSASIIPNNVVGWSWKESASNYGYLPCLVKCTIESTEVVRMPDGYNKDKIRNFVEDYYITEQGGETPDIIFILNETLFDLAQVTDINADKEYFSYIHSLENSLQGSCIVPGAGGGTNISEYEFLTSNSTFLTPTDNPFNVIDIIEGNSLATYMESLGYTSLAAHSESGLNYARSMAWPALGFDEVYFDEGFIEREYYGGRTYYEKDESLYKNLIRMYENMGDEPRVMYLLTIQNHGGYEYLNDNEYLVRTQNDYGKYTAQVNEFLTCTYLSDMAFKELVDYFNTVERDVIICMVGDHAPVFVNSIYDERYSEEELELRLRSVPYIVWSNNIKLSEKEISERIAMPFLVPKVLQLSGVKLSPYYDYMVRLQEEIPVMTSYGKYITMEGETYNYLDDTMYKTSIDRYFELEYANINKEGFMRRYH